MPEQVAKSVSDGVHILHTHTSGGRLRFMTEYNETITPKGRTAS